MPYVIEKVGTKYCVKSTPSGRTHGCHDTREKALKQQRALYRNAPPSEHSSDESSTLPPMTALPSESAKEAAEAMTKLVEGSPFAVEVEISKEMLMDAVKETMESRMSNGLAVAPADQAQAAAEGAAMWEGILAFEGAPTDDRRYLMPGEISHRELPLSLMVMTITDEGHKGAQLGGKINEIWREEREDGVVEIWGRGPFDSSEFGKEAARLVSEEFLTGVSIDLAVTEVLTLDPETYEPVDQEALGLEELLAADFITGVKGSIMGATLVPFAAFEDTRVTVVTASAMHVVEGASWVNDQAERFAALVAAAGPVKPPRGWFEDPLLTELTPLTITKDGRVYGHLADWDGCHTGFQGVCVPPFRSYTNYAYFNVGEIETDTGECMPCGKIMFCMEGNGHASVDESMGVEQVQRYYDDATKVGAFVRAGADRFGTWLAGALRPGLNDIEVQHLRTHPPSGDWRPIKGGPSELVAAFSVPVPGFPISRGRALVASAGGDITAIISGPLTVDVDEAGYRRKRRLKKVMLGMRLHNAIGPKSMTREEMLVAFADGFKNYTAEQRRKMAKAGTAMPDGSYPIADCEDAANARQAIGRAPESKRSAVQAHINKRVKVLGCSKPE